MREHFHENIIETKNTEKSDAKENRDARLDVLKALSVLNIKDDKEKILELLLHIKKEDVKNMDLAKAVNLHLLLGGLSQEQKNKYKNQIDWIIKRQAECGVDVYDPSEFEEGREEETPNHLEELVGPEELPSEIEPIEELVEIEKARHI